MSSDEPPSKAWHIIALLVVGPILILGFKAGSRIAAEREADTIIRPLGSYGPDGRPDPRVLSHIERGSGALIDVLEGMIKDGPFQHRAPIARALGFSRRLECLRPLILVLRDGCVDPDAVALPRPWPCTAYPPDELALSEGPAGREAMLALEKDADLYVRGFAHEHLVATGERSLDGELVRLLGAEGLLGERASALAEQALVRGGGAPHVALDAVPGLVALAAPNPRGRLAAALLVRSGAALPDGKAAELRALAAALSPADRRLARDPRASARAARALARGDASAAAILGELATVDSSAREALVAAVDSAESPEVRVAAKKALGPR